MARTARTDGLPFRAWLRTQSDDVIRSPLWEWAPSEAKPLISERRRRFGVVDDEGAPDVG